MKKILYTIMLFLAFSAMASGQLKPGDQAVPFTLKNVDGKMVSLSDYSNQKGLILVFTCNPCPFAKAYEQRIIQLDKDFAEKGFPVVAVNPNDDQISPEDTYSNMQARAKEKAYPFPYLKDESQEIYKAYGASKTPHIFLLKNGNHGFSVAYIGAIDDNAMDAQAVTKPYLENALLALMNGSEPNPSSTKAIGCSIKTRK